MFDKEGKGGRYIPFKRAGYDRSTGQSPNNPREQVRDHRSCYVNPRRHMVESSVNVVTTQQFVINIDCQQDVVNCFVCGLGYSSFCMSKLFARVLIVLIIEYH